MYSNFSYWAIEAFASQLTPTSHRRFKPYSCFTFDWSSHPFSQLLFLPNLTFADCDLKSEQLGHIHRMISMPVSTSNHFDIYRIVSIFFRELWNNMHVLQNKRLNKRSCQTLHHCGVFAHLYGGWPVAREPPSWKQPWGPAHRSADWACSVGWALSAAAPGTHWAGVLCTAGQLYYVQTLVPGRCMCYQPGSSGTPPPGKQNTDLGLIQTLNAKETIVH